MSESFLTAEEIRHAYSVLRPVVKRTPLQKDIYLSEEYQCNIFLKREDLQHVRSFKLRGAYYAISQLTEEELARGVVTASAGNHAQGVAYTCYKLQIPAKIYMPVTTPRQKIDQVLYFGGDYVEVILTGDTFDESYTASMAYCQEVGSNYIPPFDDRDLIAGQASVAVEIFNKAEERGDKIAYLFGAIGGGGLMSGVLSHSKRVSPHTKVIGVEPAGAASMKAALEAGHPVELSEIDKFVDGASVGRVGDIPFDFISAMIDDVMVVPEGAVCTKIIDMYNRSAIVAEPAGALSIAALEEYRDKIIGKNVVCIISGGNNDITRMQEIEERSLVYEGYQQYFLLNFPQRAGALKEFVSDILSPADDITLFEYVKRNSRDSGPVVVGILLEDKNTYPDLIKRVAAFDPKYVEINKNPMLYSLLI